MSNRIPPCPDSQSSCRSLVGCAADTKERTGEYIDDAGITTRVKAKLFDDPQTSGFSITVTTYKGHRAALGLRQR